MNDLITFNDLEKMSDYIVQSKLFGVKEKAQAISIMLLAQSEGMHPMSAVQDFDIVQGRPARKTHSILARFQSAGGAVAWEEINSKRACGTFTHKLGGSLKVEWTIEQARLIGLTGKDNWKNYPQAMLRARVIAEGIRAVFPGAIGGLLSVEEAEDIVTAPPKNMGPIQPLSVDAEVPHDLNEAAKEEAAKGVAAFRQFWKSIPESDRALLALHKKVYQEIATNKDQELTSENKGAA